MQVISQLMERSEEATQQARELAAEAEQLQVSACKYSVWACLLLTVYGTRNWKAIPRS